MLEIKKQVYPSYEQWETVINGMRNPYNSWERSDSGVCSGADYQTDKELCKYCKGAEEMNVHACDFDPPIPIFVLGEKDLKLAKNLISSGVEHAKFLRQLPVIFDINAPIFWWRQCDQYKIGTTTDSCSQMHTLLKEPFTKQDFSFDTALDWMHSEVIDGTIELLNNLRFDYLTETNEYLKKLIWREILEITPQSANQLRTWSANYAVLFNICAQRANHELKEWNDFIYWIVENVPYFRELCFDKLCQVSKPFKEMFENE